MVLLPDVPSDQPRWQHFRYAAIEDGQCAGDPFTHRPGHGVRLADGSEVITSDPQIAYGPPPTALASDQSVAAMPAPGRYSLPAYEPRRWPGGSAQSAPHLFVGRRPDGAWVAMTSFTVRNEAALRWQRTVRVFAESGRRDFALPVERAANVSAQVLADGTMLIAERIGTNAEVNRPDNAQTWLLRRAQIPAGDGDGVLEVSPRIVIAPATFPGYTLQSVAGRLDSGGHVRLHLGLRPSGSLGGPPTVIAAYRM